MKRTVSIVFALLVASLAAADDTSAAARAKLIQTAFKYKGVPYVYGSESPRAFDCSGFVRYVYRETFGIELPRSARGFVSVGRVIDPKSAVAGDVFIYDTVGGAPSHVALVVGDGNVIHAVSAGPRTGVITSPLTDRYWAPRLIGARSFIGAAPPALAKPAAGAASAAKPSTSAPPPSAAPTLPAAAASPQSSAQAAAPAASRPPAASTSTASAQASPAVASRLPASDAAPVASTATQPEEAIVDIGFAIPAKLETFTDKIPTKTGTSVAFTVTNATGKDGSFMVIFFRVDPKTYKLEKIHEQKAALASSAAYSLPPYRFEKSGKYRLIVKDNWGNQLFERSFIVTDELP